MKYFMPSIIQQDKIRVGIVSFTEVRDVDLVNETARYENQKHQEFVDFLKEKGFEVLDPMRVKKGPMAAVIGVKSLEDVGLSKKTLAQWFLVQSRLRAIADVVAIREKDKDRQHLYKTADSDDQKKNIELLIKEAEGIRGALNQFFSKKWIDVEASDWETMRKGLLDKKKRFDEINKYPEGLFSRHFVENWHVLTEAFNGLKPEDRKSVV